MKKYLFLLVLAPTLVLADTPRSTRIQTLAQKLASVESQLNANDQQAVDYYLGGIEAVLGKFQAANPLICVSNGMNGAYERFTITDPMTAATLGAETQFSTCKQLIAVQNQNLLCLSNGMNGAYEQFAPYDLGRKLAFTGWTSLKSCQLLVTRATSALMCLSNGMNGAYERFHLYNRNLDRNLGGDTQLEQCLGTIAN